MGTRRGLTCATFVVALLAAYDIPLLDLDRWEQREEDEAWQRAVVEAIRRYAVGGEEHAASIAADVGNCVRLRPEEVVAAFAQADRPVSFSVAVPLGAEVVGEIRRG